MATRSLPHDEHKDLFVPMLISRTVLREISYIKLQCLSVSFFVSVEILKGTKKHFGLLALCELYHMPHLVKLSTFCVLTKYTELKTNNYLWFAC